ncbi:MAG: D-sedoheptulose-7-phosphate isomerase [Pyrinomonadaceae bacterium]
MASAPNNLTLDSMAKIARRHFLRSIEVKEATAEKCADDIARAARILIECLETDGKILLCGNGGSAADCQHIAAEFTSVLTQDFVRPGLPAIALTTDTSFITANANDFGFEGIFERQVQALGRRGDCVIGISTSGNSKNVFCALQYARENNIKTIALTGASGGQMVNVADAIVKIPSDDTQFIQESHIAVGHILCALVELALFNLKFSQKSETD